MKNLGIKTVFKYLAKILILFIFAIIEMSNNRNEIFRETLLRYWGYASFRPAQEEIIASVYGGTDTLALLPTGGGKSICFQVPALLMDGICLVVTPLIALMKDQVESLRNLGIKALSVHSGMIAHEIDIALDNAAYGNYKFLYLSPERLSTHLFRERVQKMHPSLLVVDEAHCISQLGYDFRPSYLRIAQFRELFPNIPTLALTATATPQVVEDIKEKLVFRKDHSVFQTSFERANLAYVVRKAEDKPGQLLRIAQGVPGSGLVYVRERKKATELAEFLLFNGHKADAYHAGMDAKRRTEKQEAWKKGDIRIMVATNAFGMGIDKPDVRFVCHFDVPDAPEAYFQEAGRAGRDGKKAYAVLLYNPSDDRRLKQLFNISFPNADFVKETYQDLYSFLGLGYGEGAEQQFDFNLPAFAKRQDKHPATLWYALQYLEQEGYISLTEEVDNPSRIYFQVNRDELYKAQIANPLLDTFIKLLLRSYTGLFNGFVSIDESYLARVSRQAPTVVSEYLIRLSRMGLISYIPKKKSPQVFLYSQRLQPGNVYLNPAGFMQRKDSWFRRMEAILQYARSDAPCRSKQLLAYFGEGTAKNCGICDVCLAAAEAENPGETFERIAGKITETLKNGPVKIQQLHLHFTESENNVLNVLRAMVENGDIRIDDDRIIQT